MNQCFHFRPQLNKRTRLALAVATIAGTLCSTSYILAADANVSGSPVPPAVKTFIAKNCVACHRPPNPPLGIDLSALTFNLSNLDTFGNWVRIHDTVNAGKMPPGGRTVLTEADRATFVRAIAEPMVDYEHSRARTEGRAVLRRLNRYEYESSIRRLLSAPWLQLKDSLPEDGLDHHFNKSGQALDVSYVQISAYMEAAEHAIRLVVNAANQPELQHRYYARDQRRFIGRMHYSAFNHSPERGMIPVLGFDPQPDVLKEKVPVSVGESDPKTRELEAFATPASTFNGNDYSFDQFVSPVGGRYHLRFNAYSIWIGTIFGGGSSATNPNRTPWWHTDREKTSRGRTIEPVTIYALRRGGEKRLLGSFDVGPDPAIHDIDVNLLPDEQIMPDASRLFRSRPGFTGSPDATEAGMPGVAYRWMEVDGPSKDAQSTEGFRQLFGNLTASWNNKGQLSVTLGAPGDPERLLRQFMVAAYRRPPLEQEVQRYLRIIENQLSKQVQFGDAMIAGYSAVLCSPGFIYLEEEPGRLGPYALASRLSYFLWNGPPDPELRHLAADGTIERPEVLRRQTDRLLDDRRSRDFVDAFLDYWLDLKTISNNTPDVTLYPDYYLDDLLTESSLQETQMFFHYLLESNLPARNIIQSNFTFLNSRLARLYGLPPVESVELRKVALPPDSVRGGLLTQASILRLTANGTTTSPVLRGVFVLDRVLGEPPPPPPPGVPALDPDTRGAVTIRQQLDKHRSIQSCAVCHTKIDPPGFALENFDVVGAWRSKYRSTDEGEPVTGVGKNGFDFTFKLGQPVDASGKLADGETFGNVIELKRLLLKDERQIARNIVDRFVTYGTGAPVEFADRPEVERILDAAQRHDYGLRAMIHEIVQSDLFTHK
jgi:hypothetical protein